MKNQGRIIVGFVVVFIIALFSVLNVDAVPLNLGVTKIEVPLIFVILTSAFLGALLIFITSFTTLRKKEKEMKQIQMEKEEEINNLHKLLEEKPQEIPEETEEEKMDSSFQDPSQKRN